MINHHPQKDTNTKEYKTLTSCLHIQCQNHTMAATDIKMWILYCDADIFLNKIHWYITVYTEHGYMYTDV